MWKRSASRAGFFRAKVLIFAIIWLLTAQPLRATDYFLTLGGGYNPSGNQASLEANVVFFQQVLADKHRGPRRHEIYFADGDDPGADLQVVADKPAKSGTPATDLLASLHRRRGQGLHRRLKGQSRKEG